MQKIEITQHGLFQKHVGKTIKFIQIANKIDISLKGMSIPKYEMNKDYWKYDTVGEKLGTVFRNILFLLHHM